MSFAIAALLFDRPVRIGRFSRRKGLLASALLTAVLSTMAVASIFAQQPTGDAQQPAADSQPMVEAPKPLLLEAAIWKRFDAALDSIVTANFDETPLPDALVALMHQLPAASRVKLGFDERCVKDLAALSKKPAELLVTLHVKDIPLRSALSLVLWRFALDWTLAADRLLVISESENPPLLQRDCDLRNLAPPPQPGADALNVPGDPKIERANELKGVIRCAVKSWEESGSGESVQVSPQQVGMWRITATVREHAEIVQLLRGIRARDPAARRSPFERRLADAMEERVSVDFQATPLDDALPKMSAMLPPEKRLPLVIDARSLEEAVVSPKKIVSLRVDNVRLASALELLLQPLDLVYVGRDNALQIMTQDNADRFEVARIHDLAGLATYRVQDNVLYDYSAASRLIAKFVAPTLWPLEGEPEEFIRPIGGGRLVIRQTPRIHNEIEEMLVCWRSPLNAKDIETENFMYGVGIDADRYRSALSRPITARFENRPLSEVLRELSQSAPAASRMSIVFDRRRLEEASIDADNGALVTQEFKNVSLETSLDRILRPLEMGWVAVNDVLLVTTAEHAHYDLMSVVAYDVADLLSEEELAPRDTKPSGLGAQPLVQLREILMMEVGPTLWDDVGGPGAIEVDRDSKGQLLILQTRDAHHQIAALLRQWRSGVPEFPDAMLHDRWDKTQEIRVSVDFRATPITSAIKSLADQLPANERFAFQFDTKALEAANVDLRAPVTLKATNVRLRSALRLMLEPLEMKALEINDVILCTSAESYYQHCPQRVYDISDLIPIGHDAASAAAAEARMIALGKALAATLEPVSWDEVGGPGVVWPFISKTARMAVGQNAGVHDELRQLLRDLRRAHKSPSDSIAGDHFLAPADEARYRAALATQVSADFNAKPLGEALAALEAQIPAETRFSIVLRDSVLQGKQISRKTPITLRKFRGSLADALAACLDPLKIAVAWRDDVLLVCSAEEAGSLPFVVRAYDVTRLTAADGASDARRTEHAKLNALVAKVTKLAPEETWDKSGGYGTLAPLELDRRWLLVNQSPGVQAKIVKLLEAMGQQKGSE